MIHKMLSLHCQGTDNKGVNHDKVYHIQIIETSPGKFTVSTQYGRRGKSLKFGKKTEEPVSLWEAEDILIKHKRKELQKGYVEIPTDEELLTWICLKY